MDAVQLGSNRVIDIFWPQCSTQTHTSFSTLSLSTTKHNPNEAYIGHHSQTHRLLLLDAQQRRWISLERERGQLIWTHFRLNLFSIQEIFRSYICFFHWNRKLRHYYYYIYKTFWHYIYGVLFVTKYVFFRCRQFVGFVLHKWLFCLDIHTYVGR